MAKTSPLILNSVLSYRQDGSSAEVIVGSAGWYAWLETASVFTFSSEDGHFTAHKERAGNRRGEPYWRAYQRRSGKLHRIYLGKSVELTLERLRASAAVLAERQAGVLLGAGPAAATSLSTPASSHHIPLQVPRSSAEIRVQTPLSLPELPVPLTPLIGRDQERAALCHLLSQPHVRLVTLTGTGGVGKTRLAMQVAAELRKGFANGVCFVPLAPVRDSAEVLPTIALALGLREASALPLDAQVQDALREQHVLLLLDNFEQVLAAAPALARLLTSCAHLRLLVTSRAALHLSGEHEFVVAPLPVPDLAHLPTLEDLAQVATVRLFVERAQAIQTDFALTHTNSRIIAEICAQLDGLPLAIELAAARSKLLPPQALLQRLTHRLEVLTGGAQDLPARQQTLRNTLLWSYDLLSQDEQQLFRWLSVFVGGCTLDTAEAMYNAHQVGDPESSAVLDCIASLLDKSLVQQTSCEGEVPRLVLLETLREFGLECLKREGELEAAQEAHAHYYLELAELARQELQGPKQAMWLHRLEQEHDNLRAALAWALQATEEQRAERRDVGLRLCVALEGVWIQRGHGREARMWLERALVTCEDETTTLHASVLQTAAYVAILQGDYDQAEVWAQHSLVLCRDMDERRGIARALFLLGRINYPRGKTAEALSLMDERVRLLRLIGEPGEIADALFHLAFELSAHGEYTRGLALFEEAMTLFRSAGNELMVGVILVQSAYVLWCTLADVTRIRRHLQEGQMLINKAGSRHWSAYASCIVGLLALREGETESAAHLITESLALFREMDSRWYMAVVLHWLGRVQVQQGDLVAAQRSYQVSLALAQEQGEQFITPFNLDGLAGIMAAQGKLRWAAQLWGAAAALHDAIAIPLPPADRASHEHAVRDARSRLGASSFAAAWQEGRGMTPGQALAAQGQPITAPPRQPGSWSPLPTARASTSPSGLTVRELEVLRLVAQGLSNAQAAEQLVVSPRTINWHLTSIYSKLQVSSRSAAIRYALERHLV